MRPDVLEIKGDSSTRKLPDSTLHSFLRSIDQEGQEFLLTIRTQLQTKGTMNETLNISSNKIKTPALTQSKEVAGISAATQVTYSIICTIAILGNALVIMVFVWDKKLLKKSYNLLILSLAIADVLTAITLITNPGFVLGDSFPVSTNPVLGEIFCRVIWSRAFIFQLVVFSVYLSLALTTERWFAVVKPQKYCAFFSKKRILIYVVSSWVWSFALTCSGVIEKSYNPSANKCEHKTYLRGYLFRPLVGSFQVLMKVFVPCLVMVYTSTWLYTLTNHQLHRRRARPNCEGKSPE